ncbi:unnamed protein product [Ascophyllum nodosum]
MSNPGVKVYSYDAPQHGEIIESTYLLGDNGPKPLWKRVLGFIVLLATLVAFSYLVIFLFHNGNHRPDAREPSTKPTPPLRGAVHSSCASHPACAALGLADPCCPNSNGNMLSCCNQ